MGTRTVSTAITVEGLVKDYGEVRALAGVDLDVRTGEVFGFIGPNGAGKSTTIRILLDLLRPTAGTVRVLGEDPRAGGPHLRARLGYLPGELSLPERATGDEVLRHLAAVRGGRGADRIVPLAERFLLDLSKPVRALSKGNKQKIGVIQALMHRPELALLDEPTSGLDPLLQQEFLALPREEREEGVTVFLSSHVLSEVEGAADRVALVRDGRIVIVDDVAGLRAAAGQRLDVRFASTAPAAAIDELCATGALDEVAIDGDRLVGVWRGAPGPLLTALAGQSVVRMSLRDRDLEELVLDAYRKEL
jgi:ABC-2 type transport system ATP-binding protein